MKKKLISVVLAAALVIQCAALSVSAEEIKDNTTDSEAVVVESVEEEDAEPEENTLPEDDACEENETEVLTKDTASVETAENGDDEAADYESYGGIITYENGIEYVNGVEADYDDPGYYKYIASLESAAENGYSSNPYATASSGLTTKYGGVTYTHNSSVVGDRDISLGIDISKYQPTINWSKVKAAGVEFVFVRLGNRGYGSSGSLNLDGYYDQHMKDALNAGMEVGVYFFSQAITVAEAKEEANFVLKNLGNYDFNLPIIIDYEYCDGGRLNSSLSNSLKTQICNAFCEVIEDAGYQAGIYADKSMLTDDMNYKDINDDYDIWLAQWNTKTSYAGTYSYWQCTNTAAVDGISGTVDLDWGYGIYDEEDIVENVITDPDSGQMIYVDDEGNPDDTYEGFARNSDGWWYVVDGIVSTGTNSVVHDKKGVIDGDTDWWYVLDGKVQKHFTGLADYSNENGWWYITNGKADFSANTVAHNKNGWWYVTNGKVQFGFTGLANYSNENGWWYIKNGKVDFTYNGFAENKNGWWYLENSKVIFSKNSVIHDTKKVIDGAADWWYVTGGKVQTGFTGLANYSNENGWWYITNGKADFSANTVAHNKNGWWYVTNGKVQFGFTGLANYSNANGWWYIKNGKVDFSYKGIAENKNGWWYLKNGKVQFGYTGYVTSGGKTYRVKNGKVNK